MLIYIIRKNHIYLYRVLWKFRKTPKDIVEKKRWRTTVLGSRLTCKVIYSN